MTSDKQTMPLEVRHQIFTQGPRFLVRESIIMPKSSSINASVEWIVDTRAEADAIVEERRTEIKTAIAAISADARAAVEEAIEIDNLKAGRA